MIKMLGGGATLLAHTELIDVSNLDESGEIIAANDILHGTLLKILAGDSF